MTIATLKDFEITNIEEDYYTGSEFNGTWADNTCELCDVTIDISHNDKYYRLTIKPADPGAYGSYDDDWGRGKGISTEILTDISINMDSVMKLNSEVPKINTISENPINTILQNQSI